MYFLPFFWEPLVSLPFQLKFSRFRKVVLKLINYSCSSYPTRVSYSGQVDGFRNAMKNELKTRPCLKPVFETISNTDANFLNLHIDKTTKTRGDKQLYFILNLFYLFMLRQRPPKPYKLLNFFMISVILLKTGKYT